MFTYEDISKASDVRLESICRKARAATRAGKGAPRTADPGLGRPWSLKFMREVQEGVVWVRGEYSISRF